MARAEKATKTVARRGRVNLSFCLDDPREAVVYELLSREAKSRKATEYIIMLVLEHLTSKEKHTDENVNPIATLNSHAHDTLDSVVPEPVKKESQNIPASSFTPKAEDRKAETIAPMQISAVTQEDLDMLSNEGAFAAIDVFGS